MPESRQLLVQTENFLSVLRKPYNLSQLAKTPSISDGNQVLVVHRLASNMGTKLGVMFLSFDVTSVQENRQTQRLQVVDVFVPFGVVEVQFERVRLVVSYVQNFPYSHVRFLVVLMMVARFVNVYMFYVIAVRV